jgi:hypothetical protein
LAFPEKSYFDRPRHVDTNVMLDRLSDNLEQLPEMAPGIPSAPTGERAGLRRRKE